MKNLILILLLSLAIFSCKKFEQVSEPELVENLVVIPIDEPFECEALDPIGTETWDTASTEGFGPTTSYIYIDFDGDVRRGYPTYWGGAPVTGFAAYTGTNKTAIVDRVRMLYGLANSNPNAANWRIGTSFRDYDNTPRGRRARIVVTPTDEWYRSGVSGVAHSYSMWWLEEVPAYVFSDRLYNDTKYIGDIVAHEAGHTVGLGHQRDYRTDCTTAQVYSQGKIMGNPLNAPNPYWYNQTLCYPQNDTLILNTRASGRFHP